MKKRNLRWWHKKCWKLMSLKRRLELSDKNGYCRCITCGTIKHYKEMFAGHYKHGVLDYLDMNIHPQCYICNNIQSGQRDEYYLYLVKTYGQEKTDELRQKASMAKKGEFYTREQLEQLAVDLTLKISELEK